MSLAGVAKETLSICERGVYVVDGARVEIGPLIAAAVDGTTLFEPDDFATLLRVGRPGARPRVEVVAEAAPVAAAQRLVVDEGERRVVALNFASAKNPGGGFLRGAKSQEEDLARCSALYVCELTQRAYYDANRECGSMLYTDHVLHSPEVPFFRDESLDLLASPFTASVVTAPAPNAGEALRNGRETRGDVARALDHRAGAVLEVMRAKGHRVLVLGAWGCGVFRNEPAAVADAFARWLEDQRFEGAFDRVVFAVKERGGAEVNVAPFRGRFEGWA
ncbi:MAG: TIGR02452 family protein [Polyangiales bacterium]